MSHLFGLGGEKAGNIAAFALIVSFLFFGIILVWGQDTPTFSKKEELAMVLSIITLALGYVFGRSTS